MIRHVSCGGRTLGSVLKCETGMAAAVERRCGGPASLSHTEQIHLNLADGRAWDGAIHVFDHNPPHTAQRVYELSKLLADTYTLYLTTHNFHWNVTGPMFSTLQAMFMTQYTELWNAVDPIAERIRALGHPAPGSYAQFGRLITLGDAPADEPKATEMVRILVEGAPAPHATSSHSSRRPRTSQQRIC
jgi:DNA-binding ferritin-like protein